MYLRFADLRSNGHHLVELRILSPLIGVSGAAQGLSALLGLLFGLHEVVSVDWQYGLGLEVKAFMDVLVARRLEVVAALSVV